MPHSSRGSKLPPFLTVDVRRDSPGSSLVAPNPWMAALGRVADGAPVCRVGFGISPINDRIYVDGLNVDEEFRRCGYGGALLLAVVNLHRSGGRRLPITALEETWSASAFWNSLRNGRIPGLQVTADLRASELDDERRRWRVALMTDD